MKKITALFLALIMTVMSSLTPMVVKADRIDEKPYLSLGADLRESEKEKVYELLGVDKNNLDQYTLGEVTNKEEHEYLDGYMSSDVIGTRSLSSVLVTLEEAGHGIDVTTENISYCTGGMYRNALATAGIEDASIKVAGPFSISGTAALVGVMKAYESMTGEKISEEVKDAATNELVTTGEIAEILGDPDQAEMLMALIKEKVISEGLNNPEEILKAIEEACKELEINLSEEDRQLILKLMEKISNLDIDLDKLKEQAKGAYNKLVDMGIDIKSESFWQSVKDFINKVLDKIASFFGSEE